VKEKFMKRLRREEKGFTLIELLIVIAILGVIAAIVVPNVSGFMVIGTLNAANTEARNVQTAVAGYLSENDAVWPDSSDDLGDFMEGGLDNIKAKYNFGGDAGIESVSDSEWEGIHWEADTQTWERGEEATETGSPEPLPPVPFPTVPVHPGPSLPVPIR
jgi:type IV pilus assembly protein PilA